MKLIDDLKKYVENEIFKSFDLKNLGREMLEVLAFVLINKLREIAEKIPGTLDNSLVDKLAEQADRIDPSKKRA